MVTPVAPPTIGDILSLAIEVGAVMSPVAAGGNSLTDSTKAWVANVHRNRVVKIFKGPGAGQTAIVQANVGDSLIIRGAWTQPIGVGAGYMILDMDVAEALRDVLGGGANISAANPLPVDISPGLKTATQIITLANLALGATSTLANCTALDLRGGPETLALTVVATYNAAATLGLRVHVRTSPDNVNWDSDDWDVWTTGFTAGATLRETVNYDASPMFLKILIENLDAAQAITGIGVIASVGA